jgi:hypothetical protein
VRIAHGRALTLPCQRRANGDPLTWASGTCHTARCDRHRPWSPPQCATYKADVGGSTPSPPTLVRGTFCRRCEELPSETNGLARKPSTGAAGDRSQALPWRRLAPHRRGASGPHHGQAPAGLPDGPGTQHEAGAKAADVELSKLVVEVDPQRVLPSSGVTVGQLMERWVAHHRPWLGGTLAGTARRHAGPHPQPPTATTQSPSPVEAVGRRLRSP